MTGTAEQQRAERVCAVDGAAGDRPPHELRCMEMFGGSGFEDRAVSAPGFDVFIRSEPFEGDSAGGDVHYLSMCAAGKITRFALLDVSGHGSSVAASADQLRTLLRRNINVPDQAGLIRALSDAVLEAESGSRFATAVMSTYFAPAGSLFMTIAGHPCPLWYRSAQDRWELLSGRADGVRDSGAVEGARNLPLGVIEGTSFSQLQVPLHKGDVIVLYSDALIEAERPSGAQLGEQGLLEVAARLDISEPSAFGERLTAAVREQTQADNLGDDVTTMVLHHSGVTRQIGVGERFAALGKMLGLGG